MDEFRSIQKALRALRFFDALPESHLQTLAAICHRRRVRRHETIFCQGEPSPYCFGVLEGEVTISRVARNEGGPAKGLGVMGPGELFGESALLDDRPRAAMASASESSELLAIQGKAFREWMLAHADLGVPILLKLLDAATGRLNATSQELSVVHGIGLIMAEERPLGESLGKALPFLKNSLQDVDEVGVFVRDRGSLCFKPWPEDSKNSLSVPLDFEPLSQAEARHQAVVVKARDREKFEHALQKAGNGFAAAALAPLFDLDRQIHFLAGFLWAGSYRNVHCFTAEIRQVLTSVAHPIGEALCRHHRLEELRPTR